jgi:uncharacterized membrane protein
MPERLKRNAERYLLHPGQQRSITPVLVLTLVAMLSLPVLVSLEYGNVIAVLLIGGSAYLALVRTGAHGGFRRAAEAIVVVTTVVSAVAPTLSSTREESILAAVSAGLFVLLLLVTPLIVLVRLLIRPVINLDTVAGALAAYLQIGLFFGALYRFVSLVETQPFFAQDTSTPDGFDFMYFSFITMTTTGYGDYTAATTTGRTLAVMEAIIGQVFLVTVVALIVSNLGQENPRGRRDDQADAR